MRSTRVDAFVPASYVASEALKIDIHRRLALAETDDELRELRASLETAMARSRSRGEPLRDPGREAAAGATRRDYLVFRGGRATVGPLVLGSAELRALRGIADTAVYTSAKCEVSRRTDSLAGALDLAAAILAARQAA